jgi:hypothetical protein
VFLRDVLCDPLWFNDFFLTQRAQSPDSYLDARSYTKAFSTSRKLNDNDEIGPSPIGEGFGVRYCLFTSSPWPPSPKREGGNLNDNHKISPSPIGEGFGVR